MDEQLISLYHRHVALAYDRQLRLAEFLARKAPKTQPHYDAATATLSFGKLRFEAHLLGSLQEHNNSWLWAWSDRTRNLTLTLTNRALGTAIRAIAHRLGVHSLAAPGFTLEPLLGPSLAHRAPEVLGAFLAPELGYDAYYIADRGRTTILIRDDRLKATEKHPLRRVRTVFPQVIAQLPVLDHKAAFASYARDYGLTVQETPHAVTVVAGTDSLTATFDEQNRLTKLEGTVSPEPAGSGRSRSRLGDSGRSRSRNSSDSARSRLGSKPAKLATKSAATTAATKSTTTKTATKTAATKAATKTAATKAAKLSAKMASAKAAKPLPKTTTKPTGKAAAMKATKRAAQPTRKPGAKR
jgi:hypothetical protein